MDILESRGYDVVPMSRSLGVDVITGDGLDEEAGARAGVRRVVLVSIIGIDAFEGGYNAAKLAQEQAHIAG